ncbi:nuclear transport factor 2 family protein [Gordonia sp. LSe1-13]|uniref:Nuclear transport factor 2 family protein n=1 Tax=Gordonia sesuvii TaxID=3116777 RepID=A0ABU7MIP6_9ACTN|nr:nuclear transport factor 2 family protein [Gordonia sp. LSe1-13]
MADDIERLMEANLLEVFDERDPVRRLEAIRRTYTADVEFTDADETITGYDQINAKVEGLLSGPLAGLHFEKDGDVHQVPGMGHLAWRVLSPESGAVIASGFDVALIEDGKIAKLFTVLL